MDISLISERYAKALLNYAEEVELSDVVYDEMEMIGECYFTVRDFVFALKNPMVDQQQRRRLFEIAAGDNVSMAFDRFADLLIKHRRLECFHLIALKYCDLYRAKHNIHYCRLTTAVEVDKAVVQRIKSVLDQMLGGNSSVEIHEDVDKSIIGGFLFEMDSCILDSTITRQLQDVKNELIDKSKRLN